MTNVRELIQKFEEMAKVERMKMLRGLHIPREVAGTRTASFKIESIECAEKVENNVFESSGVAKDVKSFIGESIECAEKVENNVFESSSVAKNVKSSKRESIEFAEKIEINVFESSGEAKDIINSNEKITCEYMRMINVIKDEEPHQCVNMEYLVLDDDESTYWSCENCNNESDFHSFETSEFESCENLDCDDDQFNPEKKGDDMKNIDEYANIDLKLRIV